MHPIERLRYVARAGAVDPAVLVQESAAALAGLDDEPGNLILSARRLLSRHPASGPLWALCARLLTAPLGGNAYYLLARRKDGTVVAGGPEKFCISGAAFEVRERGNCATRRQEEAGFVHTQTNGQPGFTARIGDKGLIAPATVAQKK